MTLSDYANELFFDENKENQYRWRDAYNVPQNVRISFSLKQTDYLRYFLNDISVSYPTRTADILNDINEYERDEELLDDENDEDFEM